MQTSVTDTVNLAASVVTILGGVATLAGFVRKMLTPPGQPQPTRVDPRVAYPPAQQSASAAPGYGPGYGTGYPPPPMRPGAQGYPQQPASPPAGYPTPTAYPIQGYPASGGAPPVFVPAPSPVRRRIPHPAILGCAAAALTCVVIYSILVLLAQGQSIQTNDPRFALNVVLISVNFLAGGAAGIGMLVTSARNGAWGWFAFGLLGLVVMLFTIGILSVVLLVPACFYALYAYPSSGRALQWQGRR